MNCQAIPTAFHAASRCWGCHHFRWLSGFFGGNWQSLMRTPRLQRSVFPLAGLPTPQPCACLVLNAASMRFPSEEQPG